MTYEQIAKVLGVSPIRVIQIERRALAKLRRALLKAGVTKNDLKTCGGGS